MRKSIRQNRPGVPVDVHLPEEKVDERDGQKDQAWYRKQKVGGRIEVAQSLRKRQARCKEGILNTQNLRHAACPPNALAYVRGQALRCQTRCQRNVDVRRVPAKTLHAQRCMRILGDRLHRNSANLVERAAPQHRTRSAKEAGIPQIVPILHQAVKQFAFVGDSAELSQVSLKGIRRIEMVRRLHQSETAVAKKPSQRHLQERSHRNMVGVEDGNEFAVEAFERVIDVSRLGVRVVVARDVFHTNLRGKIAKLLSPAVIEQAGPSSFCWIVHCLGRENRARTTWSGSL